MTAGIISARQRDINAGPYDDFLQTDASINRGNSGGPMFDLKGEVIGINTAIFSPSGGSVGIGFAIPSALAKPVINQIIQYGRTRRGWLGVRIQQVTDEIAESLGVEKATGALIASITPGGPAEKAGLEAGDIILEFNNQKVHEMRELPRLVAEAKIDAPATITYWRDNKKTTTEVKVGELEKAEEDGLIASGEEETSKGTKVDSVGLSLKKITDTMRRDYAIPPSVDGVAIVSVDRSSLGYIQGCLLVRLSSKLSIAVPFPNVRPISSSPFKRQYFRNGSISNANVNLFPRVIVCFSKSISISPSGSFLALPINWST